MHRRFVGQVRRRGVWRTGETERCRLAYLYGVLGGGSLAAGLVSDLASPKRVMVAVDVVRSLQAVALGGFVWLAGFPPNGFP